MRATESRQDWKCGNCNVHIRVLVFFFPLKKGLDIKKPRLEREFNFPCIFQRQHCVFNTLLACSKGKSDPSLFHFYWGFFCRWIAENPAVLKKKIPDSKYAT